MAKSNGITLAGNAIKWKLLLWALPRLVDIPPAERSEVLERAREKEFDSIEKIGVLAGVVFVTYLLRFEPTQVTAFSLPALYFVQFVAAVPLLLLVVGPFYLRCTLRGLDEEIDRRRVAGRSEPRR